MILFVVGTLFGGLCVYLWLAGRVAGRTTEPVLPFGRPREIDSAELAVSMRGPQRVSVYRLMEPPKTAWLVVGQPSPFRDAEAREVGRFVHMWRAWLAAFGYVLTRPHSVARIFCVPADTPTWGPGQKLPP